MTPRVAFITSAAKGLGHATVKSLLLAGWDVCLTYGKSAQEAQVLEVEAHRLNRRLLALPVNLLDKQAVEGAISQCLTEFTRIDALIHNFGPFVFERKTLAEYDEDMWQRMFDGNLHNFFWMYRSVIDGMRERAFGRIITIGYDGAGDAVGWRYRSAYAAAKAGLASLTRSVAREERQNGITANMVCPGDIRGANKMKLIDEVEESENPLARPPVGEDVARLIVMLCDERSQQLNGTVTEVTGGYDILAYDDGTNVVQEQAVFVVGDNVYVHLWGETATVTEVVSVPNRNLVYRVKNDAKSGSFTKYQLQFLDAER